MQVPMQKVNDPVNINANMADLISKAKLQNFVPVVDDRDHFIGIVRRSDIIEYCEQQLFVAINQNPQESRWQRKRLPTC